MSLNWKYRPKSEDEPRSTEDELILDLVSGRSREQRDEILRKFFASESGGRASITAPSKTSGVVAKLDYLKVWVFADSHQHAEALKADLEIKKTAAQEKTQARLFALGDRQAEMKAHAVGPPHLRCEYFFHCEGAEIGMADPTAEVAEGKRRLAMLIEFKGSYCCGRSPAGLCEEVHWWAQAFGFENVETLVSRVDVCVDRYGFKVADAEVLRVIGGVVTRANDDTTDRERRRVTGVRYGKHGSPCRLTIYDKLAELRKDAEKQAVFHDAYPFAKKAQYITRYEWSLQREALFQRHSIDSVVDLIATLPDLFRYLSTEWYREVDPDSDKRATRRDTTPSWSQFVADACEQFGQNTFERKRQRRLKTTPKAQALLDQAIGCLLSRAAMLGYEPENETQLLATAVVDNASERSSVKERLKERVCELKSRSDRFCDMLHDKFLEIEKLFALQKAQREWHELQAVADWVPF